MANFSELCRRITNVYFSNLRFKLKNDCVCRLIAKDFKEASCVSILLYDAGSDRLENKGHYLNITRSAPVFAKKAELMKPIVKNLFIYEYLAHKYESNTIDSASFEDFLEFPSYRKQKYTNSNDKKLKLSKKIFDRLKTDFFENKAKDAKPIEYEIYLNYKETVDRLDFYKIKDAITPSGEYYYDLLTKKVSEKELSCKFMNLHDIPKDRKTIFRVYEEELGIKVDNEPIYLAIPLQVNARYIGLIRVLWHPLELESNSIVEQKKTIDKWLNKQNKEDLEHLANIIALHIGNTYSEHKFKQKDFEYVHDFLYDKLKTSKLGNSNESDNKKNSEIDLGTFDEKPFTKSDRSFNYLVNFCEALSKTINCRACIIRASDSYDSKVRIRGWTETVNDYVKETVVHDHFFENVHFLDKLFNPPSKWRMHGRDITLIGAQFDIQDEGIGNIVFFYLTDDEIYNSTSDFDLVYKDSTKNMKRMFEGQINKKLIEIGLSQVVILKIPYVPNGYATFGNTSFQTFIKRDIEWVYPKINRLGSEISIRHSMTLEKLSTFLANICHEIKTPASLALEKAKTMNHSIQALLNDKEVIKLVESGRLPISLNIVFQDLFKANTSLPSQFEHLIKFIDSRLGVFSITNDIVRNTFKVRSVLPYSMAETVEYYMLMFREVAFAKRNRLGILKMWDKKVYAKTITVDDDIFLGMFMYLMRNAIKYSFKETRKREQFVPGYKPDFKDGSDGHIKVNCFSNSKEYGYSITNWGKAIPPDKVNQIFEKHFRCEVDEDFESWNKRMEGDGLGMYYAKVYADLVKASLKVDVDGKKTQITVSWKNKK